MGLEVGAVVEARVTGITKFGAFVALPEGKSGLVHISEIANGYVNDVAEHLSVGQSVKAVVLSISPDGKISLSVKRAQTPAAAKAQPRPERPVRQETVSPASQERTVNSSSVNDDFEDRLKKFMRESDSRISDNRIYSEHRQRSRRR